MSPTDDAVDWAARLDAGPLDATARAALDAWLATDLCPDKLARKPFSPLPILGVPGWWADNAEPAFYDDPTVFRPRRLRSGQTLKPSLAQGIPGPA